MSKRFMVEYKLPYTHTVQVALAADDADDAEAKAEHLFNECKLWDDTRECQLMYDDFDECGDSGVPLEFEVVTELDETAPVKIHSCVKKSRANAAAKRACKLLLGVCEQASKRGDTDLLEKLGPVYLQALQGAEEAEAEPLNGRAWG